MKWHRQQFTETTLQNTLPIAFEIHMHIQHSAMLLIAKQYADDSVCVCEFNTQRFKCHPLCFHFFFVHSNNGLCSDL